MRKFNYNVCDLIKVISYQIHILNCRFNFPDLSNGATVPYNGKYRFEIWQRQINGSLKQPCILHEFLLKSLFYFFRRPFKPPALQGVRPKRTGEAVHLLHTLHQCRWNCYNYCGSRSHNTGTTYIFIYIS